MTLPKGSVLGIISAGSLAVGAVLLWTWVGLSALAGAQTIELLALLGLFVLPAGTFATLQVDRRAPSGGTGVSPVNVHSGTGVSPFLAAREPACPQAGHDRAGDSPTRGDNPTHHDWRWVTRRSAPAARDRLDGTSQPPTRAWSTR